MQFRQSGMGKLSVQSVFKSLSKPRLHLRKLVARRRRLLLLLARGAHPLGHLYGETAVRVG